MDIIAVVSIYMATTWIELESLTYFSWFIMAIKVVFIATLILLFISIIFYKQKALKLFACLKLKKSNRTNKEE